LPSLGLLLGVAASFTLAYLWNEDMWWYLSSGEAILERGHVPKFDIFLYPLENGTWITHSWLWTVLLAAVHRIAGLSGVSLLGAALVLVLTALVFTRAKLDRFGLANVLITAVILFVAPRRLMLRAEISTWFLVVVYVCFFERRGEFTWRTGLLLALLQWLWCNLHGGWPMGICIVFVYSLDAWTRRRFRRKPSHKEPVERFPAKGPPPWFAPALLLVCNLTPHLRFDRMLGALIHTLRHSFGSVSGPATGGGPRPVMEWQSTFGGSFGNFETIYIALACLAAISFAMSAAPRRLARLLLYVGMAALAFAAVRFMPGMAIATALVILLNLRELRPKIVQSLRAIVAILPRLGYVAVVGVVWLCLLVAAIGLWITQDDFEVGQSTDYFFTTSPSWACPGAADYILENDLPGPIFNDVPLGGYLTYRLYPKHQLFTDSRNLSYTFFVDEYLPMLQSARDWRTALKRYEFRTVVLSHLSLNLSKALVQHLARDSQWRLAYLDPQALVFVRSPDAPKQATHALYGSGIESSRIPFLTPRTLRSSHVLEFAGRSVRRFMLEYDPWENLQLYFLTMRFVRLLPALEKLTTEALETRADDTMILRMRGDGRLLSGRVEAGLADLREAVRLDPRDIEGSVVLATALHQLGRSPEALSELDKAMKIDPHNAKVLRLRRSILWGDSD
jgi:hypothetical protein